MSIEREGQEVIEAAVQEFLVEARATTPAARQEEFCRWVLQTVFGLPTDALDSVIVPSDKARAFHAFFEYAGDWVAARIEYEESYHWDHVVRFIADCEATEGGHPPAVQAKREKEILEEIRAVYDKKEPVVYYYVTNARVPEFHGKMTKFVARPEGRVFLDAAGIATTLFDRTVSVPSSVKSKEFDLAYDPCGLIENGSTRIAAVNLVDFAQFVQSCGPDVFASNIRQYLGHNKVNKEIQKTVVEAPENFWMYNNGITIVCEKLGSLKGSGILRLTSPQIVNGCQTANSISSAVKSLKPDGKARAKAGHLLVRIIPTTSEEDRKNITKYTNRQTAVKGKDFFALEDFQQALQHRFSLKGYYYEVQPGAYSALGAGRAKYAGQKALAYLTDGSPKAAYVRAIDAIQAYVAAILQRPRIAYVQPGSLTPGGANYADVFNEKTPLDAEYFLYPYLVAKYADTSLGYSSRGAKALGLESTFRVKAKFLFVSTAFRVFHELLVRAGVTTARTPREISAATWATLLTNEGLVRDILNQVDLRLTDFFADFDVAQQVEKKGVGYFLSTQVEKEDTVQRLEHHLNRLYSLPVAAQLTARVKEAFATPTAPAPTSASPPSSTKKSASKKSKSR